MSTVKAVRIKLEADTKQFKQKMKKSAKTMNSFADQMKKMAGMVAGAFAAQKIVSFAAASVRAYDVQAKAERELLVALKGRKTAQQELIAQAQQLQKVTLFGDEETIHAEALIAAFVKEKDQIKQIIPLVQDFAAAKKMNLAAAADLVSKTLGSSTNALSRYGIQVKGAVGSNERLQSTMKGLSEAFKGQARAAAEAGTGGLKQLSNLWGDMQEQIGGVIYKGIKPLIGILSNILAPANDVVQSMKDQQTEANLLAIQLTNANTSEAERHKILAKLKSISPAIVQGINAENISIATLQQNLKKYNQEYVKKIAIQESEDKLSAARKDLGTAISKRIDREQTMEKTLLGIKEKTAGFDKAAAAQMEKVLLSKESILQKNKEIQQIMAKVNDSENKYIGDYADLDALLNDLLAAKAKEKRLNDALDAKTKEYQDTYKRIYGLAAGENPLTKAQRDQIDNYNRLFHASLDYSKALTAEQQKQLESANTTKQATINLGKMEEQVKTLQAKRDKLAAKAFVNPNAVPESAVKQIKALDKQIADLQKKIDNTKKMMPPAAHPAPVDTMQSKSVGLDRSDLTAADNTDWEAITNNAAAAGQSLTDFKGMAINVAGAVNGAMQGMVMGVSNAFSGLMDGSISLKNFFKSILLVIADFMKQLGAALISMAAAAIAMKTMFANPWVALAAGVALVAAGSLVSGLLKRGPNFKKGHGMAEGGIVPEGYPNDRYPAMLSSGEMVVPPKKLDVSLTKALSRAFQSLNPVNSFVPPDRAAAANMLKMNPVPVTVTVSGEFVQRGSDLVAVVEENQNIRTRIRGF